MKNTIWGCGNFAKDNTTFARFNVTSSTKHPNLWSSIWLQIQRQIMKCLWTSSYRHRLWAFWLHLLNNKTHRRQKLIEHFKLSTHLSISIFASSRATITSAARLNRDSKVIYLNIKEEFQQFSILKRNQMEISWLLDPFMGKSPKKQNLKSPGQSMMTLMTLSGLFLSP